MRTLLFFLSLMGVRVADDEKADAFVGKIAPVVRQGRRVMGGVAGAEFLAFTVENKGQHAF